VPPVFLAVQKEYAGLSRRTYQGFFEPYRLDDAERAVVIMGSTAGTAKVVVDELREKGEKVGLLKVWLFRPFPHREIALALSHVKRVAVLDRAFSFGTMGALYSDIASAFVNEERRPTFVNYIYGLGGRDTTVEQIAQVFAELKAARPGELRYIGLRE
jgi:pyruvate ferredoxin oxidoreductase alpha subunit